MKPHPHYGYFPGGQPAWQTSFRTAIEPVETRVCSCCGEHKPITTFNNIGKCGACRYQEQLMRKRHGGVYSRA